MLRRCLELLRLLASPVPTAFLILTAGGFGYLVWASFRADLGDSARATAALVILAMLIAGLVCSRRSPIYFRNRYFEDRVKHLVDLLGRANGDLVIVTGRLNRELYSSKDVVSALQRMPKGVKVTIFHISPSIDDGARLFIEELRRRRATTWRIEGDAKVRHAVVVDKLHTKLEEPSVADDAEEKRAEYFLFDPTVARRVLREIGKLPATRTELPGALAAPKPRPGVGQPQPDAEELADA